MASVFLFSSMAVLGIISLFISSITATIGAYAAKNSIYYNNDMNIPTAQQYLDISLGLGWSAFILLLITLTTAWFIGGFDLESGSENILFEDNPTRNELVLTHKAIETLSAGKTWQFYVVFILIVIVLLLLAMSVTTGIAATYLSAINPQDDNIGIAYSNAIVSSVSAVAALSVIIVAIMAYSSITSVRARKVEQFKTYEKYAQSRLGITRAQLEVESQTGIRLKT